MEKYLKYGVGGVFFLLPLFFLLPPFANTLDSQLIGAKFLLGFFLGNAFFAYYLGLTHPFFALLHLVFTVSVLFTGFGTMQLYPFAYWTSAAMMALVFVALDRDTQKFLFRCVVYGACASSLLCLLQALDMDPLLTYAANITPEERRLPVGLLGQTTKEGAFLAIAFGMALGLKERCAAVLILVAALLTKSSFTYLSLLGAFVVWLRYVPRGKNHIQNFSFFGVIGLMLVPFFSSSFFMDNGRFLVWKTTLLAWWNGPRVLGFGAGSFALLYAENFQPKELVYGSFLQAHNDYLQALFEFGYLGLFVMIAGAVFLLRYFYKNWWKYQRGMKPKCRVMVAAECGLVAVLLNAIGNFPFQLAPHFFLAVLFLALVLDTGDNEA